jgi:hypothetical protein
MGLRQDATCALCVARKTLLTCKLADWHAQEAGRDPGFLLIISGFV